MAGQAKKKVGRPRKAPITDAKIIELLESGMTVFDVATQEKTSLTRINAILRRARRSDLYDAVALYYRQRVGKNSEPLIADRSMTNLLDTAIKLWLENDDDSLVVFFSRCQPRRRYTALLTLYSRLNAMKCMAKFKMSRNWPAVPDLVWAARSQQTRDIAAAVLEAGTIPAVESAFNVSRQRIHQVWITYTVVYDMPTAKTPQRAPTKLKRTQSELEAIICAHAGSVENFHEMWHSEITTLEIGRRLRVSGDTFTRWAERLGYSKEERARLSGIARGGYALKKQRAKNRIEQGGTTMTQIAAECGVSVVSLYRWMVAEQWNRGEMKYKRFVPRKHRFGHKSAQRVFERRVQRKLQEQDQQ